MTVVAVWPAAALVGCTLLAGVVLGFVVHWSLELVALRPALRAARAELSGSTVPPDRVRPVSRSFSAKFHGRCAGDCGDPIRPGDEVRFVADELVHAECAPDAEAREVRAEPPVCPRCWTVHAGECL